MYPMNLIQISIVQLVCCFTDSPGRVTSDLGIDV